MAIISVNEHREPRGYTNSQFHYAATYIIITLIVLSVLNLYCAITSQNLFYRSKEASMIEKCYLAADEIAKLEVVNSTTVPDFVGMEVTVAQRTAQRAGLNPEVVEINHPSISTGTVILQAPEVDTTLRKGDTVVLTVRRGEQVLDVAVLLGSDRD